ncbi:hypothetical protein [Streptomyces sp. NPDC056672]|uniref:hypothetical protein n=1 Tax=Streptomyces sp. NPDC056672 TaxID=3345906 RepID=UPI003696C49A
MSIIVEFFVAPDDASAALALGTGPGRAFEALSCGNFDPEEAVVEWECLFEGGDFEDRVETGEPRIIAGEPDDGCVVFVVPHGLFTALARAERFRLHEIAALWVGRRAEDGEVIEADVAGEILSDLAALARSAARQRQRLYCWVA